MIDSNGLVDGFVVDIEVGEVEVLDDKVYFLHYLFRQVLLEVILDGFDAQINGLYFLLKVLRM